MGNPGMKWNVNNGIISFRYCTAIPRIKLISRIQWNLDIVTMVKGMPIYARYSKPHFGGYFPWMLLFTEVKNIVCYTEDVVINAFVKSSVHYTFRSRDTNVL